MVYDDKISWIIFYQKKDCIIVFLCGHCVLLFCCQHGLFNWSPSSYDIRPSLKRFCLQTDWNWSLTCGDGPHFAPASISGLVSRVDIAVVVAGGLQVCHHCAVVGGGQVECLSGGLRVHLQKVVLCRGFFRPFYQDGSARQCLATYNLRCGRDWEKSEGESTI